MSGYLNTASDDRMRASVVVLILIFFKELGISTVDAVATQAIFTTQPSFSGRDVDVEFTIQTQPGTIDYTIRLVKENRVDDMAPPVTGSGIDASTGDQVITAAISNLDPLKCQGLYVEVILEDGTVPISTYSDPVPFLIATMSDPVVPEHSLLPFELEVPYIWSDACDVIGATDCRIDMHPRISNPDTWCFENQMPAPSDTWTVFGFPSNSGIKNRVDVVDDICSFEVWDVLKYGPITATIESTGYIYGMSDFTGLYPVGVNLDRTLELVVRISARNDATNYWEYDTNNFIPKIEVEYRRDTYKVCTGKGDPHYTSFDGMETTLDNTVLTDGDGVKMFCHYPGNGPSTVVTTKIYLVPSNSPTFRMAIGSVMIRYGNEVVMFDRYTPATGDPDIRYIAPFGAQNWIKCYAHHYHNHIYFCNLPNGVDIKITENQVTDDQGIPRFVNVDLFKPDTMTCTCGFCGNADGDPSNDESDILKFIQDGTTPCTDTFENGVCFDSEMFTLRTEPPPLSFKIPAPSLPHNFYGLYHYYSSGFTELCPCEDGINSASSECFTFNTQRDDNTCFKSPHARLNRINLEVIRENPTCTATNCRMTRLGVEYDGNDNDGKPCDTWRNAIDNGHATWTDDDFPDTIALAADSCRNPDADPNGPYCHDTSGNRHYCNIALCDELLCPECYTLYGGTCLYVSASGHFSTITEKTYEQATQDCECLYEAALANMLDADMKDDIEQAINPYSFNEYYFGLNERVESGDRAWSNTNAALGGNLFWQGGTDPGSDPTKPCGILDGNAEWGMKECDDALPYICWARTCGPDYTWYGGHCLYVSDTPMDFSSAETRCQNLHGAGRLVTLLHDLKKQKVEFFLQSQGYDVAERFWVDLTYDSANAVWEWKHARQEMYTGTPRLDGLWHPTAGLGASYAVLVSGFYLELDSSDIYKFVCEQIDFPQDFPFK